MRDGYYLSTYLNPPGGYRLANNWLRHDENFSLWHKAGTTVRLLGHWELERLSGQKQHETPFLEQEDARVFLDDVLAQFSVKIDDMIAVWGTPGLGDGPASVTRHPGLAAHAIGHLYSAILLDSDAFFEGTVLGLAVDRGPDLALDKYYKRDWFAGGIARKGELSLFPVDSPGPLYGAAKDHFGLREGTLMALATATKAMGECDREAILRDFEFRGVGIPEQIPAAFDRIAEQVARDYTSDARFTDAECYMSAVMKEVQAISVMMMERTIDDALERYAIDPAETHLALAGGYALNCPTNSHLMRRYGFARLEAPPFVSDCGQSVGIALSAFHTGIEDRFHVDWPGAYLGCADLEIDSTLAKYRNFVADVRPLDYDRAAADILDGPVVWFFGRSESGPRALGNRSLLGDPTSFATKERLNELKQREWWRPVAPVVLADEMDEWFEDSRPSPYMLETFRVAEAGQARVPAVAHLDSSARVQSLTEKQNPQLYSLLRAFQRRTGVPALCNTSLNDKGEPIVDTAAEAINFCLRKGLPVAYLDGRRVAFHDHGSYPGSGPSRRAHARSFEVDRSRMALVRARLNPHALTDLEFYLYHDDPQLMEVHDIRTRDGAEQVRAILGQRLRTDPRIAARAEAAMSKNAPRFAQFES